MRRFAKTPVLQTKMVIIEKHHQWTAHYSMSQKSSHSSPQYPQWIGSTTLQQSKVDLMLHFDQKSDSQELVHSVGIFHQTYPLQWKFLTWWVDVLMMVWTLRNQSQFSYPRCSFYFYYFYLNKILVKIYWIKIISFYWLIKKFWAWSTWRIPNVLFCIWNKNR